MTARNDAGQSGHEPPVEGNSRPVTSSQTGPHDSLRERVARHAQGRFDKPIADYNREAFELVNRRVIEAGLPLILDSGCGTGDSSRELARRYPDHLVVGVDRSADRLSRQRSETPTNCILVRADLLDFWRLARQAGWRLSRHYLLYPNPEPKARHLKRRFHAHPVFPDFVALGGHIESRSNWRIYLEEMAIALAFHGREAQLRPLEPQGGPLTLFERKYHASGQRLWQLETVDTAGPSPDNAVD
ncbi:MULTISPECIES: methyltransferase domain-containing protein [unclassified Guyparkeria]|uniref:tRNA (guanine(46)-N(7))-methyltransferase TrmB n=1 Tax=unclassified Guyparkeria TaxID=2626246 RepID=UPI000733446D|nr:MULTISPECIES: methyltransferase domain-containing protein [unclassified Guyparkeria]KTG17823.1 SAM-dependent methyltransferase [Guyparkeria sp. XI15]OAE89534.1 SAM-dependent methyltransferase [Guyparkeria sp. WRN-7]